MDSTAMALGLLGKPKPKAPPAPPAPGADEDEDSDPMTAVSDAVDKLQSALDGLPDEAKATVETCIEELKTKVLEPEETDEGEPPQ